MSEAPGRDTGLDAGQRRAAATIVVAKTLGNVGDLLANAKTVLTWLLSALGASPVLVGLLVPIRESGSMLPQLWLARFVTRFARRKWVSLVGGIGQALACVAMAGAAWVLPANAAGVAILVALAGLALARALSSISSKDVLGRSVPKGSRGRVTGLGTAISGGLGIAGSLAAMTWGRGAGAPWHYAAVVVLAAVAFAASGLAYGAVDEPVDGDGDGDGASAPSLSMLWRDPTLGRFVIARGLLLGSALGGPYLVLLGQARSDRLSTLAAFVLAGGLASASSSWWWGKLADRSGRLAMAWGGALAALVGAVALGLQLGLGPTAVPTAGWAALYFAFCLGYAGVRVGRKTYVVDVAGGDRRTAYVAASNTAIAIALLLLGAVGAAIQTVAAAGALSLFVATTAVGAIAALRLDDRAGSG